MPPNAAYVANRRFKRRCELIKHMGGKCEVCGCVENLEFNHRDRTMKSFNLSGAGLDTNWQRILDESMKCELLCEKHHSEYTSEQYRMGQIPPWNRDIRGVIQHGSARMYSEAACRCTPCKDAKRAYRKGLCKYFEIFIAG